MSDSAEHSDRSWMVWWEDDTRDPVEMMAPTREDAADDARENYPIRWTIAAVVGEDER